MHKSLQTHIIEDTHQVHVVPIVALGDDGVAVLGLNNEHGVAECPPLVLVKVREEDVGLEDTVYSSGLLRGLREHL